MKQHSFDLGLGAFAIFGGVAIGWLVVHLVS
jgi:hypothetical protein